MLSISKFRKLDFSALTMVCRKAEYCCLHSSTNSEVKCLVLTSFARIQSNSLFHASGSSTIYMGFRDLVHLAKYSWISVLVAIWFARVAKIFFASSLNLAICMSEIIPFSKTLISCLKAKPRSTLGLWIVVSNILIFITSTVLTALLITSLKRNLAQKFLKTYPIVSTNKGTIGESVWNHQRNLHNFLATSSKKASLRGTRASEQLVARHWQLLLLWGLPCPGCLLFGRDYQYLTISTNFGHTTWALLATTSLSIQRFSQIAVGNHFCHN